MVGGEIRIEVCVPVKGGGSPFAAANSVPVVKHPPAVPVKDRPEQGSPFTGYSHYGR